MTITQLAPMEALEFWMELKDRDLLLGLMDEQKVSARELARFAGWKSHTYLQRILRGEVKTLKTDPAIRIAYRLGSPVSSLFRSHASSESAQSVAAKKSA